MESYGVIVWALKKLVFRRVEMERQQTKNTSMKALFILVWRTDHYKLSLQPVMKMHFDLLSLQWILYYFHNDI